MKEETRANGTRTLTLLIVLVIGLGVGWLIGSRGGPSPKPEPTPNQVPTLTPTATRPTPTCPPQGTSHDWNLFVAPNNPPCLVVDKSGTTPVEFAYISATQGNSIEFLPLDPTKSKSLEIIIHVPPNYPPLFTNLVPHGNDPQGLAEWRVLCDDFNQRCSTGKALVIDEKYYGCFKYDQILDGNRCDAHIIIQP